MSRKTTAVLLVLMALLAAAVIIMGTVLFYGQRSLESAALKRQAETNAIIGITSAMTAEEAQEQRLAFVREAWNLVTLNPYAKLKGDTLQVAFSNSSESLCMASLTVTAADSNGNIQLIASSEQVQPGYYINQLSVLQPLTSDNTYAIAKVTFTLANGDEIGSISQQMVIEAK